MDKETKEKDWEKYLVGIKEDDSGKEDYADDIDGSFNDSNHSFGESQLQFSGSRTASQTPVVQTKRFEPESLEDKIAKIMAGISKSSSGSFASPHTSTTSNLKSAATPTLDSQSSEPKDDNPAPVSSLSSVFDSIIEPVDGSCVSESIAAPQKSQEVSPPFSPSESSKLNGDGYLNVLREEQSPLFDMENDKPMTKDVTDPYNSFCDSQKHFSRMEGSAFPLLPLTIEISSPSPAIVAVPVPADLVSSTISAESEFSIAYEHTVSSLSTVAAAVAASSNHAPVAAAPLSASPDSHSSVGLNSPTGYLSMATPHPTRSSVTYQTAADNRRSLSLAPALTAQKTATVTAARAVQSWSLYQKKGGSTRKEEKVSTGMREHLFKVAVRVRPMSKEESQAQSRRIVACKENSLVLVNPNVFDADFNSIAAAAAFANIPEWAKVFRFNHCLWSAAPTDGEDEDEDASVNQEGVYRALGCEIVESILSGVSASCFAFGHAGTGKTYSLFGTILPRIRGGGKPSKLSFDFDNEASSRFDDEISAVDKLSNRYLLAESSGLVPRMVTDIIEGVKSRDGACNDTRITLSFMEVHNERIRDLLRPPESEKDDLSLRVREHPSLGPYVEGLLKVEVMTPMDALRLLHNGTMARTSQPGRAHTISVLELSPVNGDLDSAVEPRDLSKRDSGFGLEDPQHHHQLFVRLQMVDLAGSEKDAPKMRSDDSEYSPSHRRRIQTSTFGSGGGGFSEQSVSVSDKTELKLIRRSLSTLGYIIRALGQGASSRSLPYRDSVLTWILKPALDGRSQSSFLATLSPSHLCYEESLSTLKYAERLCLLSSSHSILFGDGNSSSRSSSRNRGSSAGKSRGGARCSLDDFSRLQQRLGGATPGSSTTRQLLKHATGDPQQRLAKRSAEAGLTSGGRMYFSDGRERYTYPQPNSNRGDSSGQYSYGSLEGNTPLSPSANSIAISNMALALTESRDAGRALQGQLIELQIELETARADRDSMSVEVQSIRENLDNAEMLRSATKLELVEMSTSYKIAEKEIADQRGALARKDSALDRVLMDLQEERLQRSAVEASAKVQAAELNAKIDKLEREKVGLGEEIAGLQSTIAAHTDELKVGEKEVESIENENREIKERDKTLTEENAELKRKNHLLKKDLKEAKGLIDELRAEGNDELKKMREEYVALQTKMSDLTKAGFSVEDGDYIEEELRRSKELLRVAEKLARDQSLTLEQLRSELSFVTKERDELMYTHKHGTGVLLSGGGGFSPTIEVDRLKAENIALLKSCDSLMRDLDSVRRNGSGSLSADTVLMMQAENKTLRERLSDAAAETARAQAAEQTNQDNMQKEFASLWMAVQELNRLDAIKEKALNVLIRERDEALAMKKEAEEKYVKLHEKHSHMQIELQTIDRDLLAAAARENISITIGNRHVSPCELGRDGSVSPGRPRFSGDSNGGGDSVLTTPKSTGSKFILRSVGEAGGGGGREGHGLPDDIRWSAPAASRSGAGLLSSSSAPMPRQYHESDSLSVGLASPRLSRRDGIAIDSNGRATATGSRRSREMELQLQVQVRPTSISAASASISGRLGNQAHDTMSNPDQRRSVSTGAAQRQRVNSTGSKSDHRTDLRVPGSRREGSLSAFPPDRRKQQPSPVQASDYVSLADDKSETPIIESVLQNQIAELNGFLEKDRLSRRSHGRDMN